MSFFVAQRRMVAAPSNDEDQVVPDYYGGDGHLNVLAEDHMGDPVDIDEIWPTIPDGVQVFYVWEPWNDPNGEFVQWVDNPDFQNEESGPDSQASDQTKV